MLDLIPLPYRLAIAAFFVGVAALGLFAYGHWQYAKGQASTQAKWDAERVKLQAEVQAQAQRNRDLQREAEKHYTVQAEVRDHYIVTTVKEIHHETDNLAACVLTSAARGLLQRAADCASSDTPTACSAH